MARPLVNKALAVGILTAAAGIAFLVAFTFFNKGGYPARDSYEVFATFQDATGLTWKSRVQIAGIQVGEVDRIELEGNRARLYLRIRKDIDVRADACVVKRFPSTLLPDAILEMAPGSVTAPPMRSMPEAQREIKCVQEGTSIAKLIDTLSKVATDVQSVTKELSGMLAGSQGSVKQIIANLEQVSATVRDTVDQNAGKVGAILDNAESFSGTLADLADTDRARYHAIAKNIESASARLDQVLQSVQQLVGGKDGEIKQSVEDARQALKRLSSSMEKVEKVATNIGEGKGVAGKLLADERLGEKVGGALENVSDYIDRLSRLRLKVDLRTEWYVNQGAAKTYAGFTILPRPDKYYIFQIVSDPRGTISQSVQTITSQTPAGQVQTQTTTTTNEQSLAFTVEFAKRFGPAAFRIGLIESSGGVGADLYLLDDSLKLSVDVFQFARRREVPTTPYPRAKLAVDYVFFRYFYATAGMDDFLNRWSAGRYAGGPKFSLGNDVFIGAGIIFTDDDLKTLFGAAGSALSGATSKSR